MKRSLETSFHRNKRVKTEYEILDLPTKILVAIFNNLSPAQRRTSMVVSKSLFNFCSDNFSEDSSLFFTENSDYSLNGSLYQTFSNENNLRTFQYLSIKSLPKNVDEFDGMFRIIKIIGSTVHNLKILEMASYVGIPDNWCSNLYALMPNLKALEIADEDLLGDLSNLGKCKSIKLHGVMRDMKKLDEIRKIKKITNFTCKAIQVTNYHLDVPLTCMSVKLKKLLSNLLGSENRRVVQVKSDFNFGNGRSKLTPEAVTELKFKKGIDNDKLSPLTIRPFGNLKSLICQRFQLDHSISPHQLTYLKFTGVTHFELAANELQKDEFGEKIALLKSFPDLEYLKISGFYLEDDHFEAICNTMPKLKELILLNGDDRDNNICIEDTMLLLRKLPNLIKLVLETNQEDEIDTSPVNFWPKLPNLTELSLKGECFRSFDQDCFFAENWQQIEKLKIDANGYHCSNMQFIPLITDSNVTHLHIPGEGMCFDYNFAGFDDEFPVPNGRLVDHIAQNGTPLKELTIEDDTGFSLEQELRLFSRVPSLEQIRSIINVNDDNIYTRVMTREDFENIFQYLKENLPFYPNLIQTATFAVEEVVPPIVYADILGVYVHNYSERIANFESMNEMERLRNIYILTTYLGMDSIDYCRLLIYDRSA